jgi:tetratricopeptide (TPR) repeat protein
MPRPVALSTRCYVSGLLGQAASAISDCNASLRMCRDPETLESRSFMYLLAEKFREAVADYDAALAADPTHPEALLGRSIARLRLGDRAGTDADLARARDIDPSAENEMTALDVK